MNVVIIGGVAGGVSVATRLRRLSGDAKITVYEKGGFISFANCGMPYHLSGTIAKREALLLQTPERMKGMYDVDVLCMHEVTAINRGKKTVTVAGPPGSFEAPYDKLVIATGAAGRPSGIAGIEHYKNVTNLRDMADLDNLMSYIKDAKKGLVIGSGFIGLEVVENLRMKGIDLTLVELAPACLPVMDSEYSKAIERILKEHGVTVYTGTKVDAYDKETGLFTLSNGVKDGFDFVVTAAGIVPNSKIAKEAGLELDPRGYIKVSRDSMQTSDPDIYAAGDVSVIYNRITGQDMTLALAWHAKRQARIIADHIASGREAPAPTLTQQTFGGAVGTGITKLFEHVIAKTGFTLAAAKAAGYDAAAIVMHAPDHAAYYPGVTRMALKVVYDKATGQLLGAQGLGQAGVDKRIDAVATAIKSGWTVYDLADMEYAYAPPFNGPKDPLNMIGYVAANLDDGLLSLTTFEELPALVDRGAALVDVRYRWEFEQGAIPGSVNIPLDEIVARHGEIPKGVPVVVICVVGQRAYSGQRMLQHFGFEEVYTLEGGTSSYHMFYPEMFKEDAKA
ncbi:MAG TPA: FAD-dependent oxidoreductase [Terriglobales bacterium]|nr:FAD-dependent oxidoreductase [Terriglobales bacterium]